MLYPTCCSKLLYIISDYKYWANRAGRLLSLNVSNLDELIIQEAASSSKISAIQIQTALNNAYSEVVCNQESVEVMDINVSGEQ